jgi:hypothetical protein
VVALPFTSCAREESAYVEASIMGTTGRLTESSNARQPGGATTSKCGRSGGGFLPTCGRLCSNNGDIANLATGRLHRVHTTSSDENPTLLAQR